MNLVVQPSIPDSLGDRLRRERDDYDDGSTMIRRDESKSVLSSRSLTKSF